LKGVIILIIEKRGIAELLRPIAEPSGIALLSTQGFLTENAIDLAYLASTTGAKVAILTDYDISGIVIAHQVPELPRIGIDRDFLDVDLDYLSDKRIEINAVMKDVGRERFWLWIVSKLKDLFGQDLNYNRAVDIPEAKEFVSVELRILNMLVIDKIGDILKPEREA
jgi:hypothetical protein